MFAEVNQYKRLSDFSGVVTPYQNIIDGAAEGYQVAGSLIQAIIKTESNFDPTATRYEAKLNTSSAGLMQLLPSTASSVMGKTLTVQDLFDPYTNITAGTKYLKQQLDKYKNDIPLAVSAYNAGHALVDSHGAIVNSDYVNKVVSNYQMYTTDKEPMNINLILGLTLGLVLITVGGDLLFTQKPKRVLTYA